MSSMLPVSMPTSVSGKPDLPAALVAAPATYSPNLRLQQGRQGWQDNNSSPSASLLS